MALENKLGLTSSADLAREEERISKKKALVIFENGVFDKLEAGKFSALKAIHKYLFDEIFDFAGELRTINISKGNFRFAPLMYLEAALGNIDKMPQSAFDEIVEKYVEMNIAPPSEKETGAAPAFGSTSFSKLSFTRSLIGAGSIKRIIFLRWSAARLKILKSNIF